MCKGLWESEVVFWFLTAIQTVRWRHVHRKTAWEKFVLPFNLLWAMDGTSSALFILFCDYFFLNGKTMTSGWANLSMVLLKSSRDKMQCFCSDFLEKLSTKTSTGNTLVMLEDPVFSLKRRWEHNFSCYHSQETVLSEHRGQLLWSVHCAASLAKCSVWAKAFSLFRLRAAARITVWLFRGWWRFTSSCQKFSSVWNMVSCNRVD